MFVLFLRGVEALLSDPGVDLRELGMVVEHGQYIEPVRGAIQVFEDSTHKLEVFRRIYGPPLERCRVRFTHKLDVEAIVPGIQVWSDMLTFEVSRSLRSCAPERIGRDYFYIEPNRVGTFFDQPIRRVVRAGSRESRYHFVNQSRVGERTVRSNPNDTVGVCVVDGYQKSRKHIVERTTDARDSKCRTKFDELVIIR